MARRSSLSAARSGRSRNMANKSTGKEAAQRTIRENEKARRFYLDFGFIRL